MLSKTYTLVTGGSGFIGSFFIKNLMKIKKNVIIVDNLSTGNKLLLNSEAIFFKYTLSDSSKIDKLFKRFNITEVIHLAASIQPSESIKNKKKYIKNNVFNTQKLLKICVKYKVGCFIFASSYSVYGSSTQKFKENSKKLPLSVYAKTKLMSEQDIIKILKKYKIKYGILRMSNIIGSDIKNKLGEVYNHDHIFKNYSKMYIEKKYLYNVYGTKHKTADGTAIRDYLHVNTASKMILKTMQYIQQQQKNIILNCGSGMGVSCLQIAETFFNLNKKKSIINKKEIRSGDPAIAITSNLKAKKLLKIKLSPLSLKKIAKQYIEWELFLKKFKKRK